MRKKPRKWGEAELFVVSAKLMIEWPNDRQLWWLLFLCLCVSVMAAFRSRDIIAGAAATDVDDG